MNIAELRLNLAQRIAFSEYGMYCDFSTLPETTQKSIMNEIDNIILPLIEEYLKENWIYQIDSLPMSCLKEVKLR